MIQAPSLSFLVSAYGAVFKRFYLPVLAGFVFTVFGFLNVKGDVPDYFLKVIFCSVFAFTLFLAIDVFIESRKLKLSIAIILKTLGVSAVILAYFYFFNSLENDNGYKFLRIFLLELMALLMLLGLPFVGRNMSKVFWKFALLIVGRILLTFALFAVLFAGLSLAIVSIDVLFKISTDEKFFFYLWFFIVGVLSIPFFLHGIPSDVKALNKGKENLSHISMVSKYFLIPLVLVYVIVLYIYSGSIVAQWQWPNGNVSWWILFFTFVGVFAYFFSFYLKDSVQTFVDIYRKWIFVAIIPLLAVLFIAVGLRIQDYGITIARYLGVAYGVWLLVCALYFLISKNKNLIFLAVSLFVFVGVAVFGGPVSAWELSAKSQMNRLEKILTDEGILKDGKIVKSDKRISFEIDTIVRYIVQVKGVEPLQPWFDENLKMFGTDSYSTISEIINLMGGYSDGAYYGSYGNGNRYFSIFSQQICRDGNCPVYVAGYSYMINFWLSDGQRESKYKIAGVNYTLKLKDFFIEVYKEGKIIGVVNLEKLIKDNFEVGRNLGSVNIPEENLYVKFDGGEVRISNIEIRYNDNELEVISSIGANLFIK